LVSVSFNLYSQATNQDTTNVNTNTYKYLEDKHINLEEIIVTSSHTQSYIENVTKITIRLSEVEGFISNKTYPELLRSIPGVFATPDGGNYGDARLNIRGFKQENITIMLNGIPLTGFLTGSMFWNNWVGLMQATYSIQVQKGIGSSNLSSNSLGGTVNIITKPIDSDRTVDASYTMTNYGNKVFNVGFSTGKLENGWAISFVGSHTNGPGYVDATYVNSFAYMLNISKRINDKQSLLFTAVGSPEEHGKRSTYLINEEVKKYGLKYNKDWGAMDGKIKNLSNNFYHKPFLSLNHYYHINKDLFFSTSLYYSVGKGGGLRSETVPNSKSIISFQTPTNQIDWNSVYDYNINNNGVARNILGEYLAGHTWAGIKSQINKNITENFSTVAGLHYQFYYSWENEKIIDLLGGDYWFENYQRNSLAGIAGRDTIKRVGDYIRIDNGNRHNHTSFFLENKYTTETVNSFLSGLFMLNAYQRWDKYNYIDDNKSDIIVGYGGNIKAGAGYKIAYQHTVYVNVGWNSKVPYPRSFFPSNTNVINKNVKNEQAFMGEAGYTFQTPKTMFNANGYYNYWKNKSFMSNPYQQNNEKRYMISGLDAQHIGSELILEQKITDRFNISAFASVGDWRWKNDVFSTIKDDYTGIIIDTVEVFCKNLYVGDAPQTQTGLAAQIKIFTDIQIRAEWRYNTRLYADFDPSAGTFSNDRVQSYKIPSYHLVDIHVGYELKLTNSLINFYASLNNAFDTFYIERGIDGKNHDLDTFRGFWGLGRTFSLGMKIKIL
jgi:hypothetical protein